MENYGESSKSTHVQRQIIGASENDVKQIMVHEGKFRDKSREPTVQVKEINHEKEEAIIWWETLINDIWQ